SGRVTSAGSFSAAGSLATSSPLSAWDAAASECLAWCLRSATGVLRSAVVGVVVGVVDDNRARRGAARGLRRRGAACCAADRRRLGDGRAPTRGFDQCLAG